MIDLHPVGQSGPLDVVAPRLDQPGIRLVTSNPQRRFGQTSGSTLLGLDMQFFPQRRHMTEPVGKPPALALEIRGDIGRHQRRLDEEGTHPAHGVGQSAALGGDTRPTGTDQHGRGKVLLERCGALLQTITTLVQAMPRQIQRQHGLAPVEAQVHAQIRVELVDARPLARAGAQAVDDSVLDLQCAEMRVVDAGTMATELDGQTARRLQMITPVHGLNTLIQLLGAAHGEARQHQQHAVSQTRPEAQPISHLQIALPADRRGLLARLFQTETARLFQQQAFDPLGAGKYDFVTLGHEQSSASGR